MNGEKMVPWYSFAALVFIAVLLAGYWFSMNAPRNADRLVRDAVTFPVDVSYACENEMAIIAIYREGNVSLKLSDGRSVELPQVIAASGIRYANEDESFVFWSKGKDAFIEEDGEITYAGCSEAPLPV
jgi:membrane-bound inhibitor of C-type lysozyme